jgi:LSD1 subclass zinc finger protein
MSLEMSCSGCGRKLRAPENASGKKIRCPNCQAIQELPASETPTESPAANVEMWQMKVPGGQTYGPVTKLELDSWVTEGRVTNDCHLLRVGSSEWQWAGAIYPGITAPAAAAPKSPATGQTAATFAAAPAYAATPYASYPAPASLTSPKSRIVAALLAFFTFGLGIHRFYTGHAGIGLAILLVTLFSCGIIGWVWQMIEGCLLLVGVIDRDGDGRLMSW